MFKIRTHTAELRARGESLSTWTIVSSRKISSIQLKYFNANSLSKFSQIIIPWEIVVCVTSGLCRCVKTTLKKGNKSIVNAVRRGWGGGRKKQTLPRDACRELDTEKADAAFSQVVQVLGARLIQIIL